MGAGENSENLSIYFLYSEILVIFYCVSSEFSQIHTGEAGTLRNVQFYTKCVILIKPETLSKLILNNSEICDCKSIANAFNNYFANIGNNLTCNIPKVNKCPSDYLTTPLSNSFYLFSTTSIEIEQEISVPNSLKMANIVRVFKKGLQTNLTILSPSISSFKF
jgi:hypothetical protein